MPRQNYQIAPPSHSFITNQALRGICEIKPFFHQIRLTSDRLGYKELQNLFPGKIKQPSYSTKISKKQTGDIYCNFAYFHLPKTRKRIKIHYNAMENYFPFSLFIIKSPTVEELIELDLCFGLGSHSHLKFSSIEYTTDFFCKDLAAVGNLFYVLRRNYYCPYAKRTKMRGGEFEGYSQLGL